jgi:hypothetical protein
MRIWSGLALSLVVVGMLGRPILAAAQTPTQDQTADIKRLCRTDYMQYCAGVTPGGKAALQCLTAHQAQLSAPCQTAVGAVVSPSQSSAALPPPAAGIVDATWPSTIKNGGATATIYEPQPTSWPNRTTLNATAAMAILKAGTTTPIVGTVDITAATQTDLAQRWVTITNIRVLGTHFPMLDTDQAIQVQARITAIAAKLGARRIPLDTLLLAMQHTPAEAKPVETDNTPPVIFHSTLPASLVVLDGPPVLAPVAGTGLSVAVNTNWSLFQETATGQWYLLDGSSWLSAPGFTGPYQPAGALPAAFSKLPNSASFANMRKYIPNHPLPGQAPTVFVSTKPAQIIVTNGPAQLAPVQGTPLQYVRNTEAEVIFEPANKNYYVLFSGRWFSGPSLDGPWAYATPNLPADFALIPPNGPKGEVLASVPGTAQAQEAVISAQIPRQASLPRTTTTKVIYVGTPNFAPVPGTGLEYAVNTAAQIIKVDGQYYLCANGAWFVSRMPTGPWVLATSVPPAIYTIPPSSPLYPVTYVRIYSVTPTVVVTGYTAGYTLGVITAAGVVVYGTGYYYPPVIIAAPVPVYFPYPYTYAGGVAYNSASGTWARGGTVYGPYGGAGAWSAYNPQTGAYAHGSAVWGPNGGSAYGSFSNPTTGRYGSTTQNWNPYSRWGSSTISGPNQTVHTESASNARGSAGAFNSSTGAQGAGVHTSTGNNAGVLKAPNGDVYAGHDGNVYQHTDSGWSKWGNGGWQPTQQPSHTPNTMSTAQPGETRPAPAYHPPANSGESFGATHQTAPTSSMSRPTYSGGTFGQLQNDMNARQGGWQRQNSGSRQWGGGGGGRRR